MTVVSPCIHPRCNNGNGDPRLTTTTICNSCRGFYRRTLDWLIHDYVIIKSTLSAPSTGGDGTKITTGPKVYGHPAEWASDQARTIARVLNRVHSDLADDDSIPNIATAPEADLVRLAHHYLTNRFDQLCTFNDAEGAVIDLHELHVENYRMLGQTRFIQRLPTPCPWCDVVSLARTVGQIDCLSCGKVITEAMYEWFGRRILDDLIDAYDAQESNAI